MQVIKIISLVLIITGLFIKFSITPKSFVLDVINIINQFKGKHRDNLSEKIKKAKTIKKENYFEKLINETKEIMINNGNIGAFNKLIITSIVLCIIGIIISLLIDNIFVLPILMILFGLMPFYYIKIQNIVYKNEIKKELETALSSITSSYMRYNTTFLEAVKENINNINYPLKSVFQKFVITTEHINSNTKENLQQLKKAINNTTYQEWVDGIIASENDYNLKATLPNITNKFSDMRIINNELQTKMYEPLRNYMILVSLAILTVPLLYMFNSEAVISYLSNTLGKIELAIVFIVLIVITAKVFNELKPAEYRS